MTKETSGKNLSEPWRCVGALECAEVKRLEVGSLLGLQVREENKNIWL